VVERGVGTVGKNTVGNIRILCQALNYRVPKTITTPFVVRGRQDLCKRSSVGVVTVRIVLGGGVNES
jgi:hypothetical protein